MNTPTVALIVYEQMMPIHFAMAYSVFSMSDLNGKPLFDCKIVSDSDNLTNSLFHIHLDGGLEWLENADIVVMTGWHDTQVMPSEALLTALRQAYQRGATVVGLCYGAYVLACSGLLNGKKATTHWLGDSDFTQSLSAGEMGFKSYLFGTRSTDYLRRNGRFHGLLPFYCP